MKLKEKEPQVTQETEIQKKQLYGLFVKFKKKIILFGAIAFIIIVALLTIFDRAGKVTITAESTLKEILEIGELSTVDYTYNSVATIQESKKNKPYYIYYSGIVKAGIDFSKVTITKDEENKQFIIGIPPIQINSVSVDETSLKYIYDGKANQETLFVEAYKKAVTDLTTKAKQNDSLKKMATDNAIKTIQAITKPLETQLPEGYDIIYK